jgi:predicted Zn finger-like uncharacterized protein
MIIECPACQARYRIREEKLPAEGGGIKCPNCAHVFVVTPDGQLSETKKADPSHGTDYNVAVRAAEAEIEQARAQAESQVASAAPRDTGIKKAVSRWKVRNAGLVFDFADIDSVKRWLATRESLDGVDASDDLGQTWSPVAAFEDLSDLRNARKPAITMPGGPRDAALDPPPARGRTLPPAPATTVSPDEIRAEAEARLRDARSGRGVTESPAVVPSKRDAKQEAGKEEKPKKYERLAPVSEKQQARIASGSKVLAAISILILPLLLAVGLHATGTADLSSFLPFLPARSTASKKVQLDNGLTVDGALRAGASRPASSGQPAAPPASAAPAPTPAAPDSANPNGAIAANQARAAISRGDAAEAAKLLEQANQLTRNDKQILCLLAGLYDETGDKLRASGFADKCKEAGGTPERVSIPAAQPAGSPSQAPAAEPSSPSPTPDPAPATTIRRRVRPATGDGP